jgi:G protein beta subunit-like protein
VTSSEDGTVKIWDTRSGNVQRNYTHGVPVNDVVIHPNQGELISCDRGGNVRIWDLGENKCSHQLIPEDDVSVASVTVASDGSMVCAGNNAVRLSPPSKAVHQPGSRHFTSLLTPSRATSTSGKWLCAAT